MRIEPQRERFAFPQGLRRFDKRLHDPGPGPGDVAPVVTSSSGTNDAAIAMPDRQPTQLGGCPGMRTFRESKVRDRVAIQAIRTALHDDEFRAGSLNIRLDLGPDFIKLGIAGARWQRNVQLGPCSPPLTRFAGGTRTRIEKPTIFVDIGKE